MTWGKRIVLAALLVFCAVYAVLSLAQRSPEALRKGLEDYLVKSTGHYGEITELSEVRLVPDILFVMKGISIRDRNDHDKVYAHARSADISVPLWRMMFGGGGSYRAFEIKGLQLASGYLLPKKLALDFAGIADPDPSSVPAQFILDGTYNDRTLLATMEMTRSPSGKGSLYAFASKSLASFKLGGTEGQALVVRGLFDVSLDAGTLDSGGLSATFTAEGLHRKPLDIKIEGRVNEAGFNAVLTEAGDNILLTLTSHEGTDAEGRAAIKHFIESVLEDLALTGGQSGFKLDMDGFDLPSSPVKTPEDSKHP